MNVQCIVVGPIQTNCYIVEHDGAVLLIDPGDELEHIVRALDGAQPSLIVCTHYHWDHVSAVAGLQQRYGIGLALSERDAEVLDGTSRMGEHDIARSYPPPHVTRRLAAGDGIEVGSRTFTVLETPGHSPGSICLYCAEEQLLFAGDTLFAGGSYGRTDFADGDFAGIVASMQRTLSKLPDDTRVLCGHGAPTSIGAERARNPYLRASV